MRIITQVASLLAILDGGFAVDQKFLFKLICRLGLGHQITLKAVAAKLFQNTTLSFIFYTLGHGFHIEGFSQGNNTGDYGTVAGVGLYILNKGAVDFQYIYR